MRFEDLLKLVPNANGEVQFVEQGVWKDHDLRKSPTNVPAGRLVCGTVGWGIVDLGFSGTAISVDGFA